MLLISLSHLFLLPFSPFLPPLRHLTLCGPPSLFLSPIPCPFIITPSLPLVSWLAGSRWRGREGGRDAGKEGWRREGGRGVVGGRAAVICSPVHTITVPTNSLLSYFPQPNCSWISFRRTLLATEANVKNEVPQIAPCLGKQIQCCFPFINLCAAARHKLSCHF